MSQRGVDWVRCTDTSKATKREVVVEYECFLWVVEALDVLTRFGVVGTSVDMLHHMQVVGNVRKVVWFMNVKHLIHKVYIPEVPTCSSLIFHF